MICRKDTLGYVDFIRGKYNINNKNYILNIIDEMTIHEKKRIVTKSFEELWNELWGDFDTQNKYIDEKEKSFEKFQMLKNGVIYNKKIYTLTDFINEIADRFLGGPIPDKAFIRIKNTLLGDHLNESYWSDEAIKSGIVWRLKNVLTQCRQNNG